MGIKRVYDPAEDGDGRRILVDRLWPRGITKEAARVDEWLKDVTPSNELRRWYHADPKNRRGEFAERYRGELEGNAQQAALKKLKAEVKAGPVTLLTSAKDVQHSHVPVLVGEILAK